MKESQSPDASQSEGSDIGHPQSFQIRGMDCADEVAILKREVGPIVGGDSNLTFDVLRGRMTVLPGTEEVATQAVLDAVATTGMSATAIDDSALPVVTTDATAHRSRVVLTAISAGSIVVAICVHAWIAGSWIAALGGEHVVIPWSVRALYLAAIITGGWHVAPKAWYSLRKFRPDMNLLMVVAILGAVLIGEWQEGATVAFLFSVSLLLESWSIGRARRAIEALLEVAPTQVLLRANDGTETTVAPESVKVGDLFVVKPGQRVPLDGEVIEGESDVNQAPITGESLPVSKRTGDSIYAGTINSDGALVVRSSKLAEQTTLASIIRLVGEAHSRKAPSEQWVEMFARIYTPVVMFIALLLLLIPPLLLGGSWDTWVYRALVLLVIACPCALVISTPVTIVASLAAAARHGVLVKGGVFVETPARIRAIAFDKTGTLTEGKPRVVEVVPLDGHSDRELMERAQSLELRSDHPLAVAIVDHARSLGIEPVPADDFKLIQGKGAEGHIAGRLFWLGSHRYLEERGQETPAIHSRLEEMSGTGRSIVVIGNEQHVCGLIALADAIRPMTRDTLQQLRDVGVKHLIMLTGDNAPTSRAIANQIGLNEFCSELLPEDKIAVIDQMVDEYGAVAMVGDGVNDAPALARATLGIAMGAVGSDAAIETADIALMTDDLSRLPWLIGHSRRTLKIIRQNIAVALAIKGFFVALTFAGAATLWEAIAADMGASLLVILNGLRLIASPQTELSQTGRKSDSHGATVSESTGQPR